MVAALEAQRPHLIVIAAGFDNHGLDDGAQPAGVGGLNCRDQACLTRWIRKKLPGVPILMAQEGGYDVRGRAAGTLPRSVYAAVSKEEAPRIPQWLLSRASH